MMAAKTKKAPGAMEGATGGQKTDDPLILAELRRLDNADEAHRRERYRRALADIPAPGGGCHPALLRVANLAARAGVEAGVAAQEISAAIPEGARRVPPREVADAVRKAYQNHGEFTPPPSRPKLPAVDAEAHFRRCIEANPEPFPELWEASPVRLFDGVENDPAVLLRALYAPHEFIYIGGAKEPGVIGRNIRTVSDWLDHFEAGGKPGPHLIPNTLTGREGPTKDGGATYRGDSCVAARRFVLVEFDAIPKRAQAAIWLSAKLPVAAIIDSGGKSLHAWLRFDIADAGAWDRELRPLLKRTFETLGADTCTWHPARLSRMPGVPRGDDWQRLLYLDPDARGLAK